MFKCIIELGTDARPWQAAESLDEQKWVCVAALSQASALEVDLRGNHQKGLFAMHRKWLFAMTLWQRPQRVAVVTKYEVTG